MARRRGPIDVLHVDDDRDFADIAANFLERENERLTVETATTAQEALDELSAGRFDCVVSDYDMPDRTGIELLEAVRETDPELPFILFTGKGSEEVASEAISMGVTDYLQKGSGTSQYQVLANRIENAVAYHRAEEQVETTERKYRRLIEETSDVIAIVNADGEFEYLSPAAETVLGYPAEELIGEVGFEHIHPDDREHVRAEFWRLVEDPTYRPSVEFRFQQPDGSLVWVEVRGRNLQDDPVIDGLVVYARDITDRKERETSLERIRRRYEALFESTQDAIAWIRFADDIPIIEEANPRFREHFAAPGEEIVGEDIDTVVAAGERTEAARELSRRVKQGETLQGEVVRDTVDGPTEFQWHAVPVEHPETGEVEAGYAVYTDISDQKDHERRLERQRDRVKALFQNSIDPIVYTEFVEGEPMIRDVNPAFEEVFGYARETVIDGSLDEFVIPEDPSKQAEAAELNRRLEAGERIETEVRRQTTAGPRDFVLKSTPIDPASDVGRTYTIYSDITERKTYQRALEALHAASDQLLMADTPQAACETVVEIAADVLEEPYASVFLWDADDRQLRAEAVSDNALGTFGEPPTFEAGEGLVGEAFETGERIWLDDAQQDPRALDDGTASIRGYCVLPLDDHGVIVFGSPNAGAFDQRDVDLASNLAAHTTIALERISRERALRDREAKLSLLQERSQSLMYAETKAETARIAVEAVEDVIGVRMCGVHLLDEAEAVLEGTVMSDAVIEAFGEAPEYHRDAAHGTSDTIVWDAYEEDSPLYIVDTKEFDRLDDEPLTRSVIIHPIPDHGVFIASGPEPDMFDTTDRTAFDMIATALRTALDRVEREQQLRTRTRELRRQNERLEEFASVVSHDLQNPLSVARGHLELAREDRESEDLAAVARSHERMDALIEDLLTLARAGKSVGQTEPVDLAAIVKACWRNVTTEAASLRIETDATVEADETRLRQVFENLLRNAVEHAGPEVTVTVGDLEGGFYVADDGPGIPADEREDVLQAGYSREPGGTGFGLSIVRDIVDAHGWHINVTDGADGGARFEFTGLEIANR